MSFPDLHLAKRLGWQVASPLARLIGLHLGMITDDTTIQNGMNRIQHDTKMQFILFAAEKAIVKGNVTSVERGSTDR